MYNKTIIRNNIPYDILYRLNKSLFQNKDGTINKKVLGMFVAEVGADKVLEVDKKFLICKEIEDAQVETYL
jgi:translation initiation factor 2 beta subunit (eIF-2beta)/eIF-5